MKRVLIVEDDTILGELIGDTLTLEGFEPVIAQTVFQALELAATQLPDLILCDWSLPDGSVIDVLQAFQTYPVIVITSHASVDKMDQALSNGARGYLTKPFTRHELVGAVCQTLGIV